MKKPCSQAHPERCPACQQGDAKSPWKKGAAEEVAKRLEAESALWRDNKPIVLWSKHFYVASDIQKLRIHTRGGGWRWIEGHEYAHLMLTRAEQAYRDFVQAFGVPTLLRPMGIYLSERETTAQALQEVYFRNKRVPMVFSAYANASESAISGGFCLNGLSVSLQRLSGAGAEVDRALHEAVRHFVGHILSTCWVKVSGSDRTMPVWAFVGFGHWIGKRLDSTRDYVYYCSGEDHKVAGSGKAWWKECTERVIKGGGLRPIEELLDANSLGHLDGKDHQQCWVYFEAAMAEWRQPFVAMLRDLRLEVDVREAFRKNLGCTPEDFHRRVTEHLAGTRESLTDPDRSKREADDPVAQLRLEKDPRKLAALMRACGEPADARTVEALLDVVGATDSDLVRETGSLVLRKTKEPAREAIWRYGLPHAAQMTRAYAARVCRLLALRESRDALRRNLDDGFWLARTDAALALATIRDVDSQPKLRAMLADEAPKVRVGAMDALAILGADANTLCVPLVAKNLSHAEWQVRVTACETLASLGDAEAIGPLVERMQVESGRVAEEIRDALRDITGDDLGPKPEHWRDWWEKERGRIRDSGGRYVKPPPKPPDPRYANQAPDVYGVELFSARVAFVLDTSRSTLRNFTPTEGTVRRLGIEGRAMTIFSLCQEEIARSLKSLDPRTRIQVVAFGTDVFRWNRDMVSATSSNVDSAIGFVRARSPAGETNFHGALRAALDMEDVDSWGTGFRDGPDTLTFLTDGSPTVGDITDPDVLLDWYTELNRYARVRTHTFALGTLGVDVKLLGALASRNRGEFILVRELNPR